MGLRLQTFGFPALKRLRARVLGFQAQGLGFGGSRLPYA